MSDPAAYVATDDGVLALSLDPEPHVLDHELEGASVRDVAVVPGDPRTVYAACGLRGRGLYRWDLDEGVTELGLTDQWVWGIHASASGRLLVGTEPPGVYRGSHSGSTLTQLGTLEDLPSRPDWTFWYEPFEAGHVHGFAVHPTDPGIVLAAVEIGAVIRTTDGGGTWEEGLVGRDCHDCAWDPRRPDRAYVATGEGLYLSEDRGSHFESAPPLDDWYVADVDTRPDGTLFASAAPSEMADTATCWRRSPEGAWEQVASYPTDGLAGSVACNGRLCLHDADDPAGSRVVVVEPATEGDVGVPAPVRALTVVG